VIQHGDAAQAAAVVGTVGVALLLLGRGRMLVIAGLAVLAAAEGLLAYSLVPVADLDALVASPGRIAAVSVASVLVAGTGVFLARYPALLPVLALVAAPFRVTVELGDQEAFLLVPLYAVIGASAVALLIRALRTRGLPEVPRIVALPVSVFLGLAALSLLWSRDLRAGTIELLFFLFPFAALVASIARSPLREWHSRAFATTLATLGVAFAGIGIWQLWSERLFFARDLEVANAYTSYFRTTSVFGDSSLYGRELALGLLALLAAIWFTRIRLWPGLVLIAILWTGLYFTYSQSSMVALIAGALVLAFGAADKRGRIVLAVGAVAMLLAGVGVLVATAQGETAASFTSGRSTLVENTGRVFVNNPLVGVGIGAQPKEAREVGGRRQTERNASHTTPLTVAAELGAVGIAAYLALLAGIGRALVIVFRRERTLGLALGSAFVLLFVHALFYSGFFENPTVWGIVAVAAAALAGAREPVAARTAAPAPVSPVTPGEAPTSP
jgi:hypothetical protein